MRSRTRVVAIVVVLAMLAVFGVSVSRANPAPPSLPHVAPARLLALLARGLREALLDLRRRSDQHRSWSAADPVSSVGGGGPALYRLADRDTALQGVALLRRCAGRAYPRLRRADDHREPHRRVALGFLEPEGRARRVRGRARGGGTARATRLAARHGSGGQGRPCDPRTRSRDARQPRRARRVPCWSGSDPTPGSRVDGTARIAGRPVYRLDLIPAFAPDVDRTHQRVDRRTDAAAARRPGRGEGRDEARRWRPGSPRCRSARSIRRCSRSRRPRAPPSRRPRSERRIRPRGLAAQGRRAPRRASSERASTPRVAIRLHGPLPATGPTASCPTRARSRRHSSVHERRPGPGCSCGFVGLDTLRGDAFASDVTRRDRRARADEALRRRRRRGRSRSDDRARRAVRLPGPQRRRQDHHDPHGAGADPAQRGRGGAARRARATRPRAAGARGCARRGARVLEVPERAPEPRVLRTRRLRYGPRRHAAAPGPGRRGARDRRAHRRRRTSG